MLRCCLFALIVLGISRIHQHFAWIGMLRPGLVLAGIALGAALIHPAALADKSWMKRWPARVVAGLTVVTLGSIVFGISQGGAWYYFAQNFSKVLIATFLLMAAIRNVRDLWFFVWAYVIGSAILVWMALFVFGMRVEANGVVRLDTLYTWDANDIGLVLLVGLPLTLLTLRTSGLKGKLLSASVLIGIGATIARTGSRGAFLGLAVVLLAFLFSLKGTPVLGRVGLVSVMAIGLAIAAPQGYWNQMNTLTSVEQDYNWDADQGRRRLAIRSVQYMLGHPVFGIGLENFGRAEGTMSRRAVNWTPGMPGIKWSAAHNSYLQAGAELGIPGLFLFCTLVVSCIIAPWKLRRRIPAAWATGDWEQRFMYQAAAYLPLAALGFAVPALFVSFAYHDPIYILAALAGALTAAVEWRLRHAPAVPPWGRVDPSHFGRVRVARTRVVPRRLSAGALFWSPRDPAPDVHSPGSARS